MMASRVRVSQTALGQAAAILSIAREGSCPNEPGRGSGGSPPLVAQGKCPNTKSDKESADNTAMLFHIA